MSKFTHLHLHTEHSLLDGINRIETLPNYINSIGQEACAITDHGTVSGTYRFFKSCVAAGVKPILGMEAYYAVNDRTVREKDHLGKNYHHLVLLALNNTGLHNLYKLSTESYKTGLYYKPRIDDSLLGDLSEGIAATSACLGSYSSQLILKGEIKAAEALLDHHRALFGNNFFIEIQLHEGKEQQHVNKVLLEIAQRRNWPLVLSNDCHYTRPEDKQLHEESLCMQTRSLMSDPPYNSEISSQETKGKTRFSFGDIDVHVAHHDWMWARAQKQGIPYEAIANTARFADMVEDHTYFEDRMNKYPRYQNLPEGLPPWTALENLARKGLNERFKAPPPQEYQQRLERELKKIKKMGFYDYLLFVREIQEGARSLNILIGPGRGSVAGSLVAWALKITEIDPIKHKLVFERWLNLGRAARPLLLNKKMIKDIEATTNGHQHNHIHSHNGTCSGQHPVHTHRPDSVIHTDKNDLQETHELGMNLLKCLEIGRSVKA